MVANANVTDVDALSSSEPSTGESAKCTDQLNELQQLCFYATSTEDENVFSHAEFI